MASVRKYREKWLRYHARYEKKAQRVFLKTFKKWAKSIDFNNLSPLSYQQVINNSVNDDDLYKDFYEVYTSIGLLHGKRVGRDFNRSIKDKKFFIFGDFESLFMNSIEDFLLNYQSETIRRISQTFKADLNAIIFQMIQEGKGAEEIARELQRIVNRRDFYRWQALRIARTESTTAANHAALQAGQISGFKTNKMWISATDARTRRLPEDKFDHYHMNLKQVDFNDFFKVPAKDALSGYEEMRYPGDRGGQGNNTTSPGNFINCRCTVAIVAARDENGDLIPV